MPTTTKFRPRYLSVGLNIVILWCGQQEISLCNEFFLTKSFGKMHEFSVSSEFFSKCILPEIVGKYYTRPGCEAQAIPSSSTSSGDEDEEGPWCYCQQDLEGSTLIGCDNNLCKIKWYHMSCLKLKEEPEGDWICPTCYRQT